MAQAKSDNGERRPRVAYYPEASDSDSPRGHESRDGDSGKDTRSGHGSDAREKEENQAGRERVHYKGPSRQLGGYEYPEVDTAELPASGEVRKDDANNHAGSAGSSRK